MVLMVTLLTPVTLFREARVVSVKDERTGGQPATELFSFTCISKDVYAQLEGEGAYHEDDGQYDLIDWKTENDRETLVKIVVSSHNRSHGHSLNTPSG